MLKDDLRVYLKRECNNFDLLIGFIRISGFRAIALYRAGHFLHKNNHSISAAVITRLIRFSCNMDIELGAKIGKRPRIPHPLAIVIGGNTIIEDDCIIMQCTTFGGNFGKKKDHQTQPYIKKGVFIGPGAKVLGPVVVGENAILGANSVVLKDVPANSLAVGVPATIKRKKT